MKQSKNNLTEQEMELVSQLMKECQSTGDIQSKVKRLFAGTIEQMLECEMEEHLGYEKNSIIGNNSGNSRNGYNHKTIQSDYGEAELAVPRDRNGEFEPKVVGKNQTRTDEIEQKIMAMYSKGMSQRDIEDKLNAAPVTAYAHIHAQADKLSETHTNSRLRADRKPFAKSNRTKNRFGNISDSKSEIRNNVFNRIENLIFEAGSTDFPPTLFSRIHFGSSGRNLVKSDVFRQNEVFRPMV